MQCTSSQYCIVFKLEGQILLSNIASSGSYFFSCFKKWAPLAWMGLYPDVILEPSGLQVAREENQFSCHLKTPLG